MYVYVLRIISHESALIRLTSNGRNLPVPSAVHRSTHAKLSAPSPTNAVECAS